MEKCFAVNTPCVLQCIAPTRGGKSQLVKRLLLNDMFYPVPTRLFVVYSYMQPMYDELVKKFGSHVHFIKGFTSDLLKQDFYNRSESNMLIFDDALTNIGADMLKLVSETSHHCNLSVILLQQSLFPPSKHAKSINANCSHVILMNNPRDANQVACFARQNFGVNAKRFLELYYEVMQTPYNYLLIDISPHTPNELRLVSNLTAENGLHIPIFYPLKPVINKSFIRKSDFTFSHDKNGAETSAKQDLSYAES